MLVDVSGEPTKETDTELGMKACKLGVCGKRFAFVIGHDVVKHTTVLESINRTISSAEEMLKVI